MEKVTGYGKGVRVWKRCKGMKRHQGMRKVSGYGNGIRVLKWCQDMEMVAGYGNGIGLGWYKKGIRIWKWYAPCTAQQAVKLKRFISRCDRKNRL